jgi:hypothetical protein
VGKGLYGLVNDANIVGVADVSRKGGGVDPNPPRLYRPALLDQMLVKPCDPIFAKFLIKLDQGNTSEQFFEVWDHTRGGLCQRSDRAGRLFPSSSSFVAIISITMRFWGNSKITGGAIFDLYSFGSLKRLSWCKK